MKNKMLSVLAIATPYWLRFHRQNGSIPRMRLRGRLGELVKGQVAEFKSQKDFVVVESHKGNYSETLNAGIAISCKRTTTY